jgi:hypothetical protein
MRSRRFLGVLFLVELFIGIAGAQSSNTGYMFVAPGRETSGPAAASQLGIYGVGGGAEHTFAPGVAGAFGLSAEVQGIIPGKGEASSSIGILSFDGLYHLPRLRDFDPFFEAGYSLLFRDFTANAFNFGVGLNYWFRDHMAFHVEFREEGARPPIEPYSLRGPYTHYWGVRLGLTFGRRPGT